MTPFLALLKRDLKLAARHGLDSFMVVAFFVLVVTLFPLAVGPEQAILGRIGSGVIWVAALLSAMLSMDRLFQQDYEDGSLDLLVLSPIAVRTARSSQNTGSLDVNGPSTHNCFASPRCSYECEFSWIRYHDTLPCPWHADIEFGRCHWRRSQLRGPARRGPNFPAHSSSPHSGSCLWSERRGDSHDGSPNTVRVNDFRCHAARCTGARALCCSCRASASFGMTWGREPQMG